MRRRVLLPVLAVAATVVALAFASPASAHGYVASPPSRQAMCASGRVANCGEIIYEPQSVEGPKGLHSCSGGNARFAELDDPSKDWPATQVGNTVTFTWTFTARHATLDFEYWIGDTMIASFDGGGKQPPVGGVSHTVNLGGRTGRLLVLAVWNIADTANAFYSCVDLQVGGGGGNPTPSPTISPTPPPTSPPGCSAPAWDAGTAYTGGQQVSYDGHLWTAKWWTQGDIPGNNSQNVWTDDGSCTGGPTTAPTSPTTAPTSPTSSPSPTGQPSPTSQPSGTWAPYTAYQAGDVVTYDGVSYQCRQAHTSLPGWEPPNVPALWQRL